MEKNILKTSGKTTTDTGYDIPIRGKKWKSYFLIRQKALCLCIHEKRKCTHVSRN